MAAPNSVANICDDFLEFQESLKRMRVIDDKIIYALNTTIPTDSFKSQVDVSNQCKQLYDQLVQSYEQRETAIKKCISFVSDKVKTLKERRTNDMDNLELLKTLRKEQTKLRLLQSEVNIEEVVKDRSLKVYYERCRFAYKPPDIKL